MGRFVPQVRLPRVLVQSTAGVIEQPPLPVAHSFTSRHVTPSPVNPEGQAPDKHRGQVKREQHDPMQATRIPQVRLPKVLVHSTAGETEQPPLLEAHSGTSKKIITNAAQTKTQRYKSYRLHPGMHPHHCQSSQPGRRL